MEYRAKLFSHVYLYCLSPLNFHVNVSLVLNLQLGRVTWEYRDSVSVLLVSACLLLTPSDKSCTSLFFSLADHTLSGNPSTEEDLTKAEGFFYYVI